MMDRRPIPVTVIGGFLGSGKTTLVNRLLASSDSTRFVVFVNDFGELNIDYDLVDRVEEDKISLKNGCVCCTLNAELLENIVRLSEREAPPDAILIESSGVSDPVEISSSVSALEASGHVRMDAQVYVVDGESFLHTDYLDGELIIDHAVHSDLLILNKFDLVSEVERQEIEETFRKSAPYSKQVTAIYCDVPTDIVFSVEKRASKVGSKAALSSQHPEFVTQSVSIDHPIDRSNFEDWIRDLPDHCIRAKGFCRFTERPQDVYRFDLVGHRFAVQKLASGVPCDGMRAVLIGHRKHLLGYVPARVLQAEGDHKKMA